MHHPEQANPDIRRPRAPATSTKPLTIAEHSQIGDHLRAGAVYSFEGERLQARALLTRFVGNPSDELLAIPTRATGWAFYNATPGVFGRGVTGLYLNGNEIVNISADAFGDVSVKPTALAPNAGVGTSAVPWTFGYFTNLFVGGVAVGTAPASADYLVGTANGSLSAEIVVGTTPGGELGNTWASPTVDTLHAGGYHPIVAVKTASEVVTNSTTLQNDDALTMTVVSGVRYALDCFINWSDDATGEGIRFDFTGTSAISYIWTNVKEDTTQLQDFLTSTATVQVAATGNSGIHIRGSILTNSTTFTFRWACNAATGGSTQVSTHSRIVLTRLA